MQTRLEVFAHSC